MKENDKISTCALDNMDTNSPHVSKYHIHKSHYT